MTAELLPLRCTSFGVPFELASDSDGILSRMAASVPFQTEFGTRVETGCSRYVVTKCYRNRFRLLAGGEVAAEDATLDPVLQRLTTDLMVHVANYAPERVFVHAGVVGWRDKALLFPGTSFAGKTTLVAELVRAGATYYSDEYAVVDEDGRVHPYCRDLQMRNSGEVEQRPVPVEQFNGRVGALPLPVGMVCFAEYIEEGRWQPTPVSAGMAVLEMLRHSIPVQRTPARVVATLTRMMQGATAIRSFRGEASETARMLLLDLDARDAGVRV